MTDTRLRGEWLNNMRFDDLSDVAWRVFTNALMWSNENGTDGFIPRRYLRMLHPEGVMPDACVEIKRAGFWVESADGFQFDDWDVALGQSTREYVEIHKQDARDRQRKKRERDRLHLAKQLGVAPTVTRDVPSDIQGNVGRGSGEGQARSSEREEQAKSINGWSVTPIGEGRRVS